MENVTDTCTIEAWQDFGGSDDKDEAIFMAQVLQNEIDAGEFDARRREGYTLQASVEEHDPDTDEMTIIEIGEIKLTKEEKKELKEHLFNSIYMFSEYHDDITATKRDSLATLIKTFCYWAEEYNDGYFSERDTANTDKLNAYLVQEYNKYLDGRAFKVHRSIEKK